MSLTLIGTCVVLMIFQFLALVPWAAALGILPRETAQKGSLWIVGLATAAGCGLVLGLYLNSNNDPRLLANWGRFYFSILHLQIAFDLFVAVLAAMLLLWPKGGAVALAAFREGLRQPTYWILLTFGAALMLVSTIIPFFTFGEDIKVVKELCFVVATMLMPGIFGILTASVSVSEEIEGRTAVTLMSKPILRRDFLLGKFAGIALATLTMTVVLGWWLIWMVKLKEHLDPPIVPQQIPDPYWVTSIRAWFGEGSESDLVRGMLLWLADAAEAAPGLAIGFCQVLVLTSLAVALATRVPMVVNIVVCVVVFFLGHLTTILTETTARGNALVRFLAQLFDTVLPGLDFFDTGPAVVRDQPLPPMEYTIYAGHVVLYGLTFTAIALLVGLILFEDRDLA